MTNVEKKAEVLVVGAGPVGLFSALCLAERGVDVRIVDKYWRTALHSYALALHPASLRLLDELGVAQGLIGRGHRVERVGIYHNQTRVGDLDLSALDGRFPFVLVLPQTWLEAALEERLESKGVSVLWNHPAMSFDVERKKVTALISHLDDVTLGYPESRTERVEVNTMRIGASFLVGADGYHSTTRRLLGVDYRDLGVSVTYGLLEFQPVKQLSPEVPLVFHGGSSNVMWPIGADRGRWSVQIEPGFQELINLGSLRNLIRSRAPWFDMTPGKVFWSTTVTFERRLAQRFGRDRVWLAGDAAHLTGPEGVQNMNVGLREAHDLARRLTGILRNGSSLELLEAYDAERQREWRVLLGLDGAPEARSGAPEWAKDLAGRLLPCVPASGEDLACLLGQIGLKLTC